MAMADSRRRINTPFSHSVMLSMPAGTDPMAVRDAARAFARDVFVDRFDYAFALHTDADHPHIHLEVRSLGDYGERLNPKKADLDHWRQTFAQALRDRGVEAEATPRRTRGVTRKAERTPLRKIADRGQIAAVQRAAYREAAQTAFGSRPARPPWEDRLLERQARIRSLYLGQAQILRRSPHATDRTLADQVETFVRTMPNPDSQRLALARELRAANRTIQQEPPSDGRDRPKTR
jgi:type IV secretory pathway VirD2 relaxase